MGWWSGPRPRSRARGDADRGAVALAVALLMIVFMGLAAIVVDLGFARDRVRTAQNAADAGALAAAEYLANAANPQAPSNADQVAATNLASLYVVNNGWPAGADVTLDLANSVVQVQVRAENTPKFFSGAIGSSPPAVARAASASWGGFIRAQCSLCVFNSFDVGPNADVTVTRGDARIGGGGVDVGPNGTLKNNGGQIFVQGAVTKKNNSTLQPATTPGGAVADPFAKLPTPTLGLPVSPSPSGPCTQGTYSSVGRCTSFAPGIYVITGASTFNGGGSIPANQVLFYLACSTVSAGVTVSAPCAAGQTGGSIAANGLLTLTVTAGSTGAYAGIAIYGDRQNLGGVDVGGTAALVVQGSVYLKSGTFSHGGIPNLTVDDMLVVGTLHGNGNNSTLLVDAQNFAGGPPITSPGSVGLVR